VSTDERISLYDRMASELYAAVISDILDGLGYRRQVMDARIVPVDPTDRRALVGTAHTVLMAPIHELPEEPYTVQIAAIDAMQPGDVGVIATSGISTNAFWGELFSNAVIGRGGRGMVLDGYHRDTRKILELGFPVFSTGSRPFDIAGRARAIDYACPVICGGVEVTPGDVIFAEVDGVVVIPADALDETVARAFDKVSKEDRARDELREGALLSEVWNRYRVL
jgi:4-hydroxy-4-methyl-2-oxoglutarate aldolase